MARNTLKELLTESQACIVAPCVYDCASARAVELVGFNAAMLSGGELSLAMNGAVDTVGAQALQLEDSSNMEKSTDLLPREKYYAKVKAAVAALKGTRCLLIARTNADPATQLDKGCECCKNAIELGDEQDATGVSGDSATPLFDPQSYMELEGKFPGKNKKYTIVATP